MRHNVAVYQLQSDAGKAILNIDDSCAGAVIVWGTCYKTPTYLLRSGLSSYTLVVFDDEEWAKEWLENNKDKYTAIVNIK